MQQMQPQLPKGFTLLENQVAGHTFSPDTQALGMLKDESIGCVLKPMGKPQCGERELSFYESVTNATDPVLAKARDLVPKFYDKVNLLVNSKNHTFLKLEDLSHGMVKPCIMDIKIGRRTWDPLASPQKQKVEEKKYFFTKYMFGLSLPGFQVYKNDILHKYGKDFGKQLSAIGLKETIRKFLNSENKICYTLIREVLRQLYSIRDWFMIQTALHFYASSLLIVYDYKALELIQHTQQNGTIFTNGAAAAQTKSSNNLNSYPPNDNLKRFNEESYKIEDVVKVRMIDFAHVFPAEDGQLDDNYLFGLKNLIKIIEEING